MLIAAIGTAAIPVDAAANAATLGTKGIAKNGLKELIQVGAKRATRIFNGLEVRAVRDLGHVGESTLKQMAVDGFAARNSQGEKLYLHHLKQNPSGPIIEMPAGYHDISNKIQHPYGNAKGMGLTKKERVEFNPWRENYWRARAKEELGKRGITTEN